MRLPRRAALLLPLLAAACGGEAETRTSFPPLRYDYLPKLQLNVASIEFGPPPPPTPLEAQDPAPPGETLLQLAHDRLAAGGTLGKAVFTIEEARIVRISGGLEGALAVRLDVQTSEGNRAGFAEARVSRRSVGAGGDLRAALYDITKGMMDDMNVELEFQIRRSLRDWFQDTTTAPPPAAVQQQDLSAPRAVP